jgi:hypothetical protein
LTARIPGIRARRLLVGLLIAAGLSALASPPQAHAGCITRLPVRATLPSLYSGFYYRILPLRVSRVGPPLRRVRAALYTFRGLRVAEGFARGTVFSTRIVLMYLKFGPRMQSGPYTLYIEGEPNADSSCGPKHFSRVQSFRPCPTRLPVTFPDAPGGFAADYDGYLSVAATPLGALITNLDMTAYDAAGQLVGEARKSILFGESTFDMPLTQPLHPGPYTVYLEGTQSGVGSCGPKTSQVTLSFA